MTAAKIGPGPDVGRENRALAPSVGLVADWGPRKETAKLQRRVAGGKLLPPVLELRQPRGLRSWKRVLLPAVPRTAATRPHSRPLQPYGLVRKAVLGNSPEWQGRQAGTGLRERRACLPWEGEGGTCYIGGRSPRDPGLDGDGAWET